MVQQLGAAVSGRWDVVESDVAAVARVVRAAGAELKVILECGLLDDDGTREAARRAVAAGADWVKTSTGFLAGGATVADVELLHATVGGRARVKASGGIRTLADARAMLVAGAERLGTSSGVAIVEELAASG
jgi:deoxyribose-phosphate aldolase